jgi:trigger factor
MKASGCLSVAAALLLCSVHAFHIAPVVSTARQVQQRLFLASVETEDASTSSPKVTRLENSAVMIDIPVPGTATKAAYDKVCMELSKTIQIPGFRKGSRIPPQVLEQSMAAKGGRNAIKVQAINELTNQLVELALKEQALDPIGQPTLKVPAEELAKTFVPGESLTLSVQCDVWPEIQWNHVDGKEKPYVGLTGKYQRKPFNQAKLDLALRDLKERYATLETIDDANYKLQLGDACTVNMNGYMATDAGEKGEPLPNAASGDRVEVILGPGRYMEGLVEGLIGTKKGDTVTVRVSFPEVRVAFHLGGMLLKHVG